VTGRDRQTLACDIEQRALPLSIPASREGGYGGIWREACGHYAHGLPDQISARTCGLRDLRSRNRRRNCRQSCSKGTAMNTSFAVLPAIVAALASGVFALAGVIVTSRLTQRREHEAAWRQTKIEHYQEYISALSAMVSGRSTPAAQDRYADAVNALALVASPAVLDAVHAFQAGISCCNTERSDERHDALLNVVIQVMRDDIQPSDTRAPTRPLRFLAPPPTDQATDVP
jgi:hypothetical protein